MDFKSGPIGYTEGSRTIPTLCRTTGGWGKGVFWIPSPPTLRMLVLNIMPSKSEWYSAYSRTSILKWSNPSAGSYAPYHLKVVVSLTLRMNTRPLAGCSGSYPQTDAAKASMFLWSSDIHVTPCQLSYSEVTGPLHALISRLIGII